MYVLQSGQLMLLRYRPGFHSDLADLEAPPLQFGRNPPQINYPPGTVRAVDGTAPLDTPNIQGGISYCDSSPSEGGPSKSPTYAEQNARYANTKL